MGSTIIVYPGQATGSNIKIGATETVSKLVFQPLSSGSDITVYDSGTVQYGAGVTLYNLNIIAGHVYGTAGVQGQSTTVNAFNMFSGLFETQSGMYLRGEINVNGGQIASYGNGSYFYYDSSTLLNIEGGTVRFPTPIAKDGTERLPVSLGPQASFQVLTSNVSQYYFRPNSKDYKIDIIDLKYYGHTIKSVVQTSSGITINLVSGSPIQIYGDFPGIAFREGPEGGIELFACFAEGTLISTPAGSQPVEDLSVGDLVMTETGSSPIIWVGHKSVNASINASDESLLVRVRAHAFEANRPARDLWLTPEHCIWDNGVLIPVRCLVNDASIAYDRTRRHYTYYHFILEDHKVVYAEDLPTESYQPNIAQVSFDTPEPLPAFVASGESLPHLHDPEKLKSRWVELSKRAHKLGHAALSDEKPFTLPRTVRLRTDLGAPVELLTVEGEKARFSVPANTKYIVVESEARRPDQEVGRYIDDRRTLGVRVGRLSIKEGGLWSDIRQHLTAPRMRGWNNIEDGVSRWTSGAGMIPLRTYGRHAHPLEIEVHFPDYQNLKFQEKDASVLQKSGNQ